MSKSFVPPTFAAGAPLPTFLVTYVMFGPNTNFRISVREDGTLEHEQLTPWGDKPDLELREFIIQRERLDGRAGETFRFDAEQTEHIEVHGLLNEILLRIAAGASPDSAYRSAMEGEEPLSDD